MKTKIYMCVAAFLVLGMSTGIILGMNRLSVRMQAKETLVLEKQTAEKDLAEKYAELQQLDADILVQQKEVELYEQQLDVLAGNQETLHAKVEQLAGLYGLALGGIPVNYDVENFRAAEKVQEQASKGFGLIFGSFLGNMLNNDDTSNVSGAEKLRLSLYEKLSAFLDDSYRELAAAKVSFDGSYAFYQELAQMDSEERLLENAKILEAAGRGQICVEEQEALLHALGKYTFDLSIVYMMYDNTLTENETSFLSGLQAQLQNLQGILALYGGEQNIYGYSPEEKLSRYKAIMTDYVTKVWELTSRNADNGIVWGSTITDYGNSVNKGHFNKNQVVIMEQRIVNSTSVRIYYYDRQGNPIYADFEPFDLIILDGVGYEVAPNADSPREHEWLQQWVKEAIKVKDEYCDAFYGDGRY